MSKNSTIEWTKHTFNPWRGCAKVHEGCAHCYAERDSKRFPANRGIWGPNGTRVMASAEMWRQPLAWNRAAEEAGERHLVFCASLADVFEDWQGPIVDAQGNPLHHGKAWISTKKYVPIEGIWIGKSLVTMDDLRRDLFALIDQTPNLDWLLLTKRPENVRRMWPLKASEGPYGVEPVLGALTQTEIDESPREVFYRSNCYLGTSISLQEHADKQIPELLKCRDLAPVLFLSMEPLLGPVDLGGRVGCCCDCGGMEAGVNGVPDDFRCCHCAAMGNLISWVIVGGESGPGARPCDTAWIRSIVKQCQESCVPCFVKQLGGNVVSDLRDDDDWPQGTNCIVNGMDDKKEVLTGRMTLNDKKGGNMQEWPDGLRVRQFPEVKATVSA